MIVGVTHTTARVRCPDGTVFPVNIEHRIYEVPARDGSGKMTHAMFDMRRLLVDRELPLRVTGDLAVAAKNEIYTRWPPCEEKFYCLELLRQYIEDVKDRRRDAFVIKMAKLYGPDVAVDLSSAIRNRRFHFNVGLLLTEQVAGGVGFLTKEFPGSTRMLRFSPTTLDQAHRALYKSGGSKVSEGFRIIAATHDIKDEHIPAIFDTVRYLEGGTIKEGVVR